MYGSELNIIMILDGANVQKLGVNQRRHISCHLPRFVRAKLGGWQIRQSFSA
jgi:hypothetical protein